MALHPATRGQGRQVRQGRQQVATWLTMSAQGGEEYSLPGGRRATRVSNTRSLTRGGREAGWERKAQGRTGRPRRAQPGGVGVCPLAPGQLSPPSDRRTSHAGCSLR